MPAVMDPPARNTSAAVVPAVDYVRELPPEDQEAIFIYLLKELIRINGGNGLITIGTDREQLGYYVPPKAADFLFEKYGPRLTAEQEAEFAERIKRKDSAVPVEEVLADLKRLKAENQQRQSA